MSEQKKYLDLNGLSAVWENINEIKQNKNISIENVSATTIEEALTEIATTIKEDILEAPKVSCYDNVVYNIEDFINGAPEGKNYIAFLYTSNEHPCFGWIDKRSMYGCWYVTGYFLDTISRKVYECEQSYYGSYKRMEELPYQLDADVLQYFTSQNLIDILKEIGSKINNIDTIIVDEEFNVESSNPIANKTVAKLAKDLDYETGVFGIGDEAWWVYNDNNPNILKFYPYSIEGTYEKAGDFCTITAKVEKVENWKTIYYSLPMSAIASASTVVTAADNQIYKIWTTTQNYDGVDHSVIAIERQDGSNMTRISGEDPNNEDPTSFIEFTLRYKYR